MQLLNRAPFEATFVLVTDLVVPASEYQFRDSQLRSVLHRDHALHSRRSKPSYEECNATFQLTVWSTFLTLVQMI